MQVVDSIQALHPVLAAARQQGKSIGFVPTMGNLHDGHMALVKMAQSRCDSVVVSIFVNPLQFDRKGDLSSYPQTLESDLERCREMGVGLAFVPSEGEMYAAGHSTTVSKPKMGSVWVGAPASFPP